jgi:hypothetical protein
MSTLQRSPLRLPKQMAQCAALGTIANRAESIRTLVKKLGPVEQLRACYEAGPTSWRSWASCVK